jgi:hypothetical protein
MKLSKKNLFLFILLFFLFVAAILLFLLNQKTPTFNPVSEKSKFYDQLNLVVKTGHLETSSLIIRDFLHQVEFNLKNGDNTFKVILSDQKNPIWQIASLQEVIKTAKINNQTIKLVDLSINNPYATFKNN